MLELDISADGLVSALLSIAETEPVCILDSCGVGNLGSHLLIAGIEPESSISLEGGDAEAILVQLDEMARRDLAAVFTLSYDFGLRLNGIKSFDHDDAVSEPDLFLSTFRTLIVHDYNAQRTYLSGDEASFERITNKLTTAVTFRPAAVEPAVAKSNFTKSSYLEAIETIKERIRSGDTYQTNLTQQFQVKLANDLKPADVFYRLRKNNPAPFSAFIQRPRSTVVSSSPERFFHVSDGRISTSPIKGTRPRGTNDADDRQMRDELLASGKDRAENTMIVDLLRNDLGRVCEFGSVHVDDLCVLEEHPTLFHLVSTVSGKLRTNARLSDIFRAVFPCGSITGAPKISTMRIIHEIEPSARGLSMGAIGYFVPGKIFGLPPTIDVSVAIRTMVIRDDVATLNVGGGIVIDSDPNSEFAESLTKAKALFEALGVKN